MALVASLCLALPLALAPQARGQRAAFEAIGAALRIPADAEAQPRTRAEVVAELAGLGPRAIAPLLAVYSGEALGPLLDTAAGDLDAWCAPPDELAGIAHDAIAEMPPAEVVTVFQRLLSRDPTQETRVSMLRTLGALGSERGLRLSLDIAVSFSAKERRYSSVRRSIEDAVAAILARGGAAARELETVVLGSADRDWPDDLLALVATSMVQAERPEGVQLLLELLGTAPALDRVLLESMVELDRRFPWRVYVDIRPQLQAQLYSKEPELRRAAAHGAGVLRDIDALDRLIELLEDDEATVRRAARSALAAMSGNRTLSGAEEWRAWFSRELKWWNSEGKLFRAELEAGDPARLAHAVRELLRRPLARDAVVDELTAAMARMPPDLIDATCEALVRMEANRAIPGLVDLMFEESDRSRAAAWKALCRLTGRELPSEPWVWEEYIHG